LVNWFLYPRFDKQGTGSIAKDEFLQFYKENRNLMQQRPLQSQPAAPPSLPQQMTTGFQSTTSSSAAQYPNPSAFEAGQLFSRFDVNRDGKLDKREFEELVKLHPELVSSSVPFRANPVDNSHLLPVELVTGRLLTHYDETACVGITTAAVDQHKAMGNVVYSLVESYRNRYDRLRTLLTGRLLPRR
jgi:hypothetical protein